VTPADVRDADVVRLDDGDDETLAVAAGRYLAGPEGGPQQKRVVAVTRREDAAQAVDTAADRVASEDEPMQQSVARDLIAGVLDGDGGVTADG
jgi:uncharacterized protein YciI